MIIGYTQETTTTNWQLKISHPLDHGKHLMVWSFSHKEAGSHWNGSKGWQQTPVVDFIMSHRYARGIDFKETTDP